MTLRESTVNSLGFLPNLMPQDLLQHLYAREEPTAPLSKMRNTCMQRLFAQSNYSRPATIQTGQGGGKQSAPHTNLQRVLPSENGQGMEGLCRKDGPVGDFENQESSSQKTIPQKIRKAV